MDPVTMELAYGRGLDLHSADRVARLGRAALMLSRELAASRRENAELRRENAELRRALTSHQSGGER